MKQTNLRRLIPLVALALVLNMVLSGPEVSARPDAPEPFTTEGAVVSMALDPDQYSVFWGSYDGCPDQEFQPTCRIRLKGVDGAYPYTVFNNVSGSRDDDLASNVAADNDFVYWVSDGGQILRLSRYGGGSPSVVATKATPSSVSRIGVDDNWVYWTENVGDTGTLFRAAKSGGAREFMTSSADSDLRQLKVDGQGGAMFIADINAIICCLDVLHRVSPDGAGGFDVDVGTTVFVQTYTSDDSYAYWATTSGPGSELHIERAPLTDLGSASNFQPIGNEGSPEVHSMAVDETNLYWHEYRSPDGGPINRRPLAGGAVQPITGNLNKAADLTSTGRYLFWIEAENIYRLAADTPPISLDLRGDEMGLEVVQVIQSQAHDVPLVEEKTTFVRAFGRIGFSSEGLTQLRLWPPALLYGTRDGVPLPGSPLRPLSPPPLRTGAINRTTLDNTLLFQLPESWAEGTITLRAEVNPRHARAETNYTNNSAQRTVTFQPTQGVCLDFLPVLTTAGISQAGLADNALLHIARAKAMLPLSDLGGVFRGGSVRTKPVTGEPYNMNETDDRNELMFHLTVEFMFSSPPANCGDRRTIRTIMVPSAARFGLSNGVAPIIYFLENYGGPAVNYPRGGNAGLAHELGHQFGRAHVACPPSGSGAPTGTDSSYPYNTCQIDNTNTHIGFDAITHQLIVPLASSPPSDLMSYGPTPNWPSDYTYGGMFNNLSLSRNVARGQSTTQTLNGDALFVSGYILDSGDAYVGHAYELSDLLLSEVSTKISDTTVISAAYELRLYDPADQLLEAVPLRVNVVEGEIQGDGGMVTFSNLVTPHPDLATISVVETATDALASRTAGEAAPQIAIDSPASGGTPSNPMVVSWTASDPDGDPLMYQVRYSNDNGTNWFSLGETTDTAQFVDTTTLPGGSQGLIQVLASDGLHSAEATLGPLTIGGHAPQAVIQSDDYRLLDANTSTTAAQNEAVVLRGMAQDPEDGDLTGSALQWQINGPITRTTTGTEWTLTNLPPGIYDVQLEASDSDGQSDVANTALAISPKRIFDGAAPLLDGMCDDPAYAADQDSITLPYDDGTQAEVRFVHTADYLFACFSGLMLHAGDGAEQVKLEFDLDDSGGSAQQADDPIFWAGRDAWFQTGKGDGSGGETSDSVPQGLLAAVQTGDIGWQAEMRIDVDVLDGWNKSVSMRLAHELQAGLGLEQDWPDQVQDNVPDTWGRTAFGQLSQSITFPAPPDRRFDEAPFDLDASISSGLPISYTELTTDVCSVSGGTVRFAGLGTCTVRASQPGDTTYGPASDVSHSFQVLSGTQTIAFPALQDKTPGDPPFTVLAAATSGLPVAFNTSTPGVCAVDGDTVTLLEGGTCTLTASQPGNANYLAAPEVSRSFNVTGDAYRIFLPAIVKN